MDPLLVLINRGWSALTICLNTEQKPPWVLLTGFLSYITNPAVMSSQENVSLFALVHSVIYRLLSYMGKRVLHAFLDRTLYVSCVQNISLRIFLIL